MEKGVRMANEYPQTQRPPKFSTSKVKVAWVRAIGLIDQEHEQHFSFEVFQTALKKKIFQIKPRFEYFSYI